MILLAFPSKQPKRGVGGYKQSRLGLDVFHKKDQLVVEEKTQFLMTGFIITFITITTIYGFVFRSPFHQKT